MRNLTFEPPSKRNYYRTMEIVAGRSSWLSLQAYRFCQSSTMNENNGLNVSLHTYKTIFLAQKISDTVFHLK